MIKLKKGLLLVMFVLLTLFIASCGKKSTLKIIHHQGQYGIVTTKKEAHFEINNQSVDAYQTTDQVVNFLYESYNLDNTFDNTITINGYTFPLLSSQNTQNDFVLNQMEVIGLLMKEDVVVKITSGMNAFNSYDNFHLRNIRFVIGNVEVYPNEYPKDEYLNEAFFFGSPDLKSPYRSNYKNSETYTFSIPKSSLKHYGALLDFEEETLKVKGIDKALDNPSFIALETNLESKVYTQKLPIEVRGDNLVSYKVLMNDVEVKKDLTLHPDSWASGEHNIKVIGFNQFNFSKVLSFNVTLEEYVKEARSRMFDYYETGLNQTRPSTLELGVKLDYEDGIKSPFSKYAMQNFKLKKDAYSDFVWEGNAPENRTLTLEVFNHKNKQYEVVSVNKAKDTPVKLGFNYDEVDDWFNNDFMDIRITSFNQEPLSYDKYIYHISDTQYISEKANGPSGVIKDEAINAFHDMREHILSAYQDNLIYTMITGDMIQSIVHEGEWETFMGEFFNGLVSEDRPIGVLTGNHDVGGTSDYNPNGGNGLDDVLSYESFGQHLGEDVFNGFSWYGGNYSNNRSHYDLIDIHNETYLFLHLGWGSDRLGVHVSSQDVNYAKQVLELHSDKRVILLAHEYLNNRGQRTNTGNYLFEELVIPYKNIVMVFSGHINGSTYKIDHLDDDNDGIADRSVLQSLTNFQEEANLNGASFIRKLGLDFTNNKIGFELHSPYYNDQDIFVRNHPDIVARDRNFSYDFDFNQLGYGLITYGIK